MLPAEGTGRGHSPCQGPGAGQELAWCAGGRASRPLWLEQSEHGGQREREEEDTGRSCRALWASRGKWDFYPGRREPWRLWAEGGRGLRQSLVGGFWKELQGAQEGVGTEPMTMTALDQVEAEEGEKADARSAVKAKLT